MADKEERILITKCSSHCHALRVNYDPFDDDHGMYCDKSGKWVRITEKDCEKCKAPVLLGISRSEVIDKMAKAFYAENVVRCNSDDCPPGSETCDGCPIWENCKHLAKIALNSLFEVQK